MFTDELKSLEACVEVLEYRINSAEEEYFNDITMESTSNTIWKKLKVFFIDIISSLKKFLSDIKIDISKAERELSGRKTLKTIDKNLREAKKKGKKNCTITDLEAIRSVYYKMYNDVKKVAHRFTQPYSDPMKVEKDIDEFYKIIEKYEKELHDVKDKKITMSIEDGIRYVGKELSDQTRNLDIINDVIADLEKMKKDAELLAKRHTFLGGDALEKQRNILVRAVSKLVSTVKNFFVKFIVAVCVIF